MRARILAAAACAIALAACHTTTGSFQTDSAKGLYVAEAAFDGATLAAEQAVKAGLLKGANAQTADAYLTAAHTALVAARAAYAAGNATNMAAQVAAVTLAVANVEALVKGN